jgi:hypothetical protein
MTPLQQKKLALFLAEWRHTKWERGSTDCVMFILKMHDRVYDTGWTQTFEQSYTDLMSGRRMLGLMNQSQWLALNKYQRVDEPRTGDIALLKDSKIPSPYVVFEGKLWGFGNHKGKIKNLPIEQCGLELDYYRKQ